MKKILILHKVVYDQTVFLERLSAGGGEFLVKVGEKVEPFTVVGRCLRSSERKTVNLCDLFKVRPEVLLKGLFFNQTFSVNEPVAMFRGFFKKTYLAPFSGQIESFNKDSGELTISSLPEPKKILSGLAGEVFDVISGKSLLIKSVADLVVGVWGKGDDISGELVIEEKITDPSLIKSYLKGKILAVKEPLRGQVLDELVKIGLGGLVVGSLFSRDIAALSFPVLLTEGVGELSMSTISWDFLSKVPSRHCYLSANNRYLAVPIEEGRKPLDTQDIYSRDSFNIGDKVKIFSLTNFGLEGEVVELSDGEITFPSGLTFSSALIKVSEGEKIWIPLANLGLLV